MHCGLHYPEQNVAVLGIDYNLVEFDFEKMKITKNVKSKTENFVQQIEKVNDDTFLVGELYGYIELINKKDLSCLSHLQVKGELYIY